MWKRLLALVTKTTTVSVITLKWVTSVANRNQEYLGIPKAPSYRRSLSLSRAFVRILEALCNQYHSIHVHYTVDVPYLSTYYKNHPQFFSMHESQSCLFYFSFNLVDLQIKLWHRVQIGTEEKTTV